MVNFRNYRPKYIREMVDDFAGRMVLSKNLVTFHYRFDKQDWSKSCKRPRKEGEEEVHSDHMGKG